MKELQPNEVLVSHLTVIEKCIGTDKTNTNAMISFIKAQETFDFVDVFLRIDQVMILKDKLDLVIKNFQENDTK